MYVDPRDCGGAKAAVVEPTRWPIEHGGLGDIEPGNDKYFGGNRFSSPVVMLPKFRQVTGEPQVALLIGMFTMLFVFVAARVEDACPAFVAASSNCLAPPW